MRRQFRDLRELSCTELHLQDGVWWRKGWDSNPRYRRIGTPDFESGAFDHSATFPRATGGEAGRARVRILA